MRFLHAVKICRRYFPLVRAHLASTYGAMLGDAYLFDGVRIGLGLYGYFPEGEAAVKLLPAMRGTAPCVARRTMLFGGAGYGTERTDLIGTEISVLRCGYADGFGRSAERSGLQPRLLGDFCMDVAIAEQRIEPGRRMVLFDDAKQLAQARGISVYEALCLMGLRAEKNYIYD